jgi:hypothetical protein
MIYGLVTLAAPWAGGKMNNWSLLNNKPIINGSKRVLTFTIMSVIGGVGWGGGVVYAVLPGRVNGNLPERSKKSTLGNF